MSKPLAEATPAPVLKARPDADETLSLILSRLDDMKAEETITIDLRGKSSITDYMIVTSGRANRHVGAIAENVTKSLKETGITSPDDFKGRTLGVWFFGNEYPFYAWMNKLGISTEGGDDGVTVLKQSFDVQPLIQKQADCISVMTYNEYWQLMDAGYKPEDLIVFNYSEMGVDLLEDGLYAMEDDLKDPAFADKMVRFVSASMKGWKYAIENPDEAAEIVMDNGGQDENHQKRMMGEVAKLIGSGDGVLKEDVYERTAQALLDQGIIENEPEGAWTHEITDEALK